MMNITKKMKKELSEAYPEVQMIALNKELADDEIDRNLNKKDCMYVKTKDETQLIMDEIGKREIRKVVLWSSMKQKFKCFTFF